eukprot:670486-Lingulodinium_polyedra.AAC.1
MLSVIWEAMHQVKGFFRPREEKDQALVAERMRLLKEHANAKLRLGIEEIEEARLTVCRASRALRAHRRRLDRENTEAFGKQLVHSWHTRNFAQHWRIARALARRCRGPKKRRYNVAA